jgi:hypothetical protein
MKSVDGGRSIRESRKVDLYFVVQVVFVLPGTRIPVDATGM